ncbi:MAG: RNA polymerase sigma factor [Chloroflexi bacterium]|jgi:RNA polymerase sigma-70 factor (ECF subfamily)|nr:RNA polymerase sigma factor [Chloroflexota bacterium]
MHDRSSLADFEAFYERTYPVAFRVAYGVLGDRDLAEDATQDAYVAAYRDRERYRGDGPVDAWLYRIVVHAAISVARRRRSRVVGVGRIAPDGSGPDEGTATLDRLAIEDGLRELDPRARSAVVLRYYLDLDYATIGSILGTSADNVGVILTRSRDRLRRLMEPAATGRAPFAPEEAIRHG